ncbi:MAG TPA: hypothetical protein VHB50_19245, partial [Bryobacteraceae bacterium]|nr:hypothetical protein [Bryobacteraceae bacterium]
ILPLILWMLWRVFQNVRIREALAAVVVILLALPLWTDISRIPKTLRYGPFPASNVTPSDWSEMGKLFGYIREHTPTDAVICANLDPVFYLNTGRKAIRGFSPDGYRLYYAPSNTAITPDQLAGEIIRNGVGYVALTPDRDFAESGAYHKAVEALERGGVLEPVAVPGVSRDYRLLRVAALRFRS